MNWIKTKALDEVSRVDIGDNLPAALTIQEKFLKFESKVEVHNIVIIMVNIT